MKEKKIDQIKNDGCKTLSNDQQTDDKIAGNVLFFQQIIYGRFFLVKYARKSVTAIF